MDERTLSRLLLSGLLVAVWLVIGVAMYGFDAHVNDGFFWFMNGAVVINTVHYLINREEDSDG